MDLINPFADKTLSRQQDVINPSGASLNAQVRHEILVLCLKSTKDFFESFMTIPASEYNLISFVQWNALIFATMVLYRLSLGLASIPEWNPEIARSSVPLETYLDHCCQLMSAATSTNELDDGKRRNDLFSLMAPIWNNVRDTYLRLRDLPWDEAVADQGKVHATNFPSHHTSVPRRCPALALWSRKGSSFNNDNSGDYMTLGLHID